MRYNTVIINLLFVCLVQVAADIRGWSQEQYPNIFSELHRCGRPNDINETWICDPDGILSVSQGNQIDDTLRQIKINSNCLCVDGCSEGTGFRIAVALVQWMTIEKKFIPKKEQAYHFANYLMSAWFGDYNCDNNAVVFYAYEHNQLAFALGDSVKMMVSELEYASLVDDGRSRLGRDLNSTYVALDYIIRKLNDSIQNGPGVSLSVVYSVTVIGALLVVLFLMCLISNTCCRVEIPRKLNVTEGDKTVGKQTQKVPQR
ncbi:uncharacterized protein LOC117118731 [Anneissia japonica]|uniref:uncharacterized protein LOC117118731 n=1 Tax=Anneissia japonica TaxID=1529436 RepID=UPI001425ABC5|nr:uncharacterized protein LOC117118731 [Anneissia japonica]